jgi:methionyl-tRNA synthetase
MDNQMVSFKEFKKLDIRVGKVISVENHPNADRLYILKIDIGTDVKQCVAGLKPYLLPDQLQNKSVVVVANLQPAVLRGVESQVMILAASDNNEVVILSPAKELPAGSRVS